MNASSSYPASSSSSVTLTLATRESPLALWQARHVQSLLQGLHPQHRFELLGMTTRGDQILDRSLSKVGGKGLFVKELELALLEGRAQLAVHSLKDVPMQLEAPFSLAAILKREDPRDCLVLPRSGHGTLAQLPAGARVGTSSLRRELMLRARFPHLQVLPVRGNVGTRLRKLDEGEFDALVMAAAGLKRLGLAERVSELLAPELSLPAPGQGALAIEVRADDAATAALVAPLNDEDTRRATAAERAVSRALGGSCDVPLAAYAQIESGGRELVLRAIVGHAGRGQMIEVMRRGASEEAETLAADAVAELRARGALELIRAA